MKRIGSRTYSPRAADIKRQWHVIDASGQTLGRLSTRIASLLMGKHKPMYAPNADVGDFVMVVNAAKVVVTGNKATQKVYYRHSGYPGGFKETTYEALMEKDPTLAIRHSVHGMLPHTFLSARTKKRLRIYAGTDHPDLPQVKLPSEQKPKKEPVAAEAKAPEADRPKLSNKR